MFGTLKKKPDGVHRYSERFFLSVAKRLLIEKSIL